MPGRCSGKLRMTEVKTVLPSRVGGFERENADPSTALRSGWDDKAEGNRKRSHAGMNTPKEVDGFF
jgi:hypothetical protein